MTSGTNVIQVTNVSPGSTSEQMRTLFGFLGTVEEMKLFPPDDSTMPVTSRVCFVKFRETESVGVSQHLTNTVFVDRALIVVPYAEGVIPDEAKALSLLAPANAVAGILPGGGLLPTPNPLASMGNVPLASLGTAGMDPGLAAFGLPGSNMNQSLAADQLLKFMTSVDPKMNPMAAGMALNPVMKADASSKEIEEAMKRVREAQSLISAAIEPDKKDKRKRSRSRSRRRHSRSRSRHRRSRSRSRRRSRSRSRRRSKSPRRRRSRSRDRSKRSNSRTRDRRKEEKKKRSRTPPKSYSTARRSRSSSRKRRRSRSKSWTPKKKVSRTPSPRRHKKEKKKDRGKERDRDRKGEKDRSRDEREGSGSKKKRTKDKERDRDRKSDSEKGDVKVTRDYDEEEQGYDSEKEREAQKESDDSAHSPGHDHHAEGNGVGLTPKDTKVNGDHQEDDMDVSD
ncbi:serine/arginine-rich splicing factor 11-like [Denticeps clupeoides]|uniref:Serine/arginine-rich splicing factor 11 n=1 Tax=Denticeps clupeoides TaxID=299321 RepID=A0AAY4A0K2_9TELE|nr:serine/arginine-rich splicing factor 11-like [Denticeps clupeoides]XP_028832316.1 serine/arginine-rich splicing factor 11-like [Denticeps clupeoides]